MIHLRRLTGETVLINPDLIRQIDITPDSVLTFVNGEKLVVLETPDEIVDRIVDFRRRCNYGYAQTTLSKERSI